jgi:hypothetical protein
MDPCRQTGFARHRHNPRLARLFHGVEWAEGSNQRRSAAAVTPLQSPASPWRGPSATRGVRFAGKSYKSIAAARDRL